MKRRHRYALNLFSLGLLAIALYLNFVKRDQDHVSSSGVVETMAKPEKSGEPKIATSKASIQTLVLK